ncbi:aminotransferase class I/II-fold pyridoxal phosphate-dependent enzyme [Candidatus Gracilibacteria bacterium]|nr:aminotransferase class I/II-fold pyridoxal phosphate-dependent enzyme [Candidatus Gracilibacteria bacterium]MCF7819536.1 aminotransferase class I/II-fold pyridoxal phosphate-dependent enzyme [Candidatus Gracilibacteria bacterium]
MSLNPQAEQLNGTLEKETPLIARLLSRRGRAIFWPREGILKQSAEAKNSQLNATVGIATEHGQAMKLESLHNQLNFEPNAYLPYAPSFGIPELRETWRQKIQEKNPSLSGPTTLPIVTSGLTHALSMIGYLFVDEGDRIILPDKFWGNYKLVFQNGYDAVLDSFETFREEKFNFEGLKHKLLDGQVGKKIILLNAPNNPSGYTPTREEAEIILQILREAADAGNKLLVICDDAYFGLVYEENILRESFFAGLADLHPNILAVKIDGCTKEEYTWGLRVGFITFGTKDLTEQSAHALEQKTAGAIRGNVSNSCHLSQRLILQTFESRTYEEEKQKNYDLLHSRYEKVRAILHEKKETYAPSFRALPFNSGYFMCLELKQLDSEQVRQILLKEFDTGVIAVGNLLRIAFSSVDEEQLEKLFDNIFQACKRLSS